jgi:diguanylate cyclase (GGDEF)-like protein/PAS domain S-box-containing protein
VGDRWGGKLEQAATALLAGIAAAAGARAALLVARVDDRRWVMTHGLAPELGDQLEAACRRTLCDGRASALRPLDLAPDEVRHLAALLAIQPRLALIAVDEHFGECQVLAALLTTRARRVAELQEALGGLARLVASVLPAPATGAGPAAQPLAGGEPDAARELRDCLATVADWIWETDDRHRLSRLEATHADPEIARLAAAGRASWSANLAELRHLRSLRNVLETRQPFRGLSYTTWEGSERRRVEIGGVPIMDGSGRFLGYRGTARLLDAAELDRAEMRDRLDALSESGLLAIAVGRGETIAEANATFLELVGRQRGEVESGRLDWATLTPAEWRAADATAAAARARGRNRPYEKELLGSDGRRIPVQVTMIPLAGDADRWMCLIQDLRERKRDEARIRELAFLDPLTRLPNRRRFSDELGLIVGDPGRVGALLFVDLDHFKDVNDMLGHAAGDALLRHVAQRLRRSVRRDDLVARLGGDEFAIVLDGAPGPKEAGAVARKLFDALRQPFSFGDRVIHASASIGIALFPRDGDDPAELLKNADLALYRAKAQGRRAVCFFDPTMQQELETRLALVADLRRAIDGDEFRLVYQPIVRLRDGAHCGFEVLIRWAHPRLGLLSPAAFLDSAEESGLIVPLGRAVLRSALAQLREWLAEGLEPGHLSINVAAAQLRSEGLAADVDRWLGLNALRPDRLTVEITENVLLDTGGQIGPNLRRLNRLGVAVALDDFGTGYASLSHLKRFPVDVLKIDRSFVANIGRETEDAVIARTIVNLAHSLGMAVVAEGIEGAEQLDFLRLNGCDFAQGFLFARPLDPGAAGEYLRGSVRLTPTDSAPPPSSTGPATDVDDLPPTRGPSQHLAV